MWTVLEAKAKLSEVLRLARDGEPQIIGSQNPCVVISAQEFERLHQGEHLGQFLVRTAPKGFDLQLPPRDGPDRGNPFDDGSTT